MRKTPLATLYSTTALVAVGAFVGIGAAQADEMMAEPISVSVGGYTTAAIGFANDSSDMQRGHGLGFVYEFGISGSTTLDNGITVGVHAQLGESGGPFDEQYLYFSGSFGELKVGETESASQIKKVGAPGYGIGGMIGVNAPWFSTAAPSVDTGNDKIGEEDANKLVYSSPNFNGVGIALSYAPEDNTGFSPGRGDFSEQTAVGVSYTMGIMGGSLSAGGGYEVYTNEAGGDATATRFGASISVDQLSFGGGMLNTKGGPAGETSEYDLGFSWTEGAVELGLQWGHNEESLKNIDIETDMVALHATYTLGPGVLVGGQIASGRSTELADDVTQFMLGTTVFF